MKHNTIFASLGKTEDENGEAIGSHAYYLVKLAQEKAELKDATAVLKKKIKKEESDLRSLQKALTMIKSSNSDFRTGNLRKKTAEDAEMVSLKEEASSKREELQQLRRSVDAAEVEIEQLEARVKQRDSHLEALKAACEERQEALRTALRAVEEQEARLERAASVVARERSDQY